MSEAHPPWVAARTILCVDNGSRAYGTYLPGESDEDILKIVIPPAECYLGLSHYDGYNSAGGKTRPNTAEDTDVVVKPLGRFVHEAVHGSPTAIWPLFVNLDAIYSLHPFGRELLAHRHEFLSKRVKERFGGYARSQQLIAEQRKGREKYVQAYGYDTKAFMHAVRMFNSAIEILGTGDYHTHRPERDELLACRHGKYTYDQALQILADLDRRMNEAAAASPLPDVPNEEAINRWLTLLTMRAITEPWDAA